MEIPEYVKTHPAVIAAGGAVVLFLVWILSRGSGGASGASADVASQQIAAGSNVALNSQATQYDMAALQLEAVNAQYASTNHTTDVNASTAVALQSLSNMNNIDQASAALALNNNNNAASIAINANNVSGALANARIQSNTAITLGPIAASLAQSEAEIAASSALSIASTNANAATTIANINASAALSKQQMISSQQNTQSIIQGLPALAGIVSAFM
jgi:hypothetical protein